MNLQEKAMLFEYHLHGVGSGAKKDKDMTNVANIAADVRDDAGYYVKRRYPPEFLKPIVHVDGKIRKHVMDNTIPYNDYGLRLLPVTLSFQFLEKWRELLAERERTIDECANRFHDMVNKQRIALNGNFRREDYPIDEQSFRESFEVVKKIRPLPDEAHILFDLGQDEMTKIREEMKNELSDGVASGVKNLFDRLRKAVEDMRNRLQKNLDDGTSFHKTILTNITDVLGKVPALNLTEDPNLTAFAAEIAEKLASIDITDLREEDHVKKQTVMDVEAILKKMEGYV